MDYDEAFDKLEANKDWIFVIAVIAAIAVLFLAFSVKNEVDSKLPIVISEKEKNESYVESRVSGIVLKSAFFQDSEGNLVRETIIENTGETIDLDAFDVVPEEYSRNVNEVVFEPAAQAEFLSLSPVIRKTTLSLKKGESAKITRKTKASNPFNYETAPLLILTKPVENDEQLLNELKKTTTLGLGFVEVNAFEKKVLEESIKKQNPTRVINSLNTAVEEARMELQENPSIQPRKPLFLQKNLPYKTNSFLLSEIQNTEIEPTQASLFPELPESIEFTATETNPIDEEKISIESTDLGAPLVKITGVANNFVSFDYSKTSNGYDLFFESFVSGEFKDGFWQFDSAPGVMEITFSKTPNEKKLVPINIEIKHEQAPLFPVEEFGTDLDATVEEIEELPIITVEPQATIAPSTCLQDAQKLVDAAKKYEKKRLADFSNPCQSYAEDKVSCACFVSLSLKEGNYGSVLGRIEPAAYRIFNLAKSKGAIEFGVNDLNKLKPGDLVFFKNTYAATHGQTITHVGIYVGNDKMIHSGHPVNIASVSTFRDRTGKNAFYKALRVIPSCINEK
ncbi:C40 family peptidase [Candidatus Micrarchaeota archaeon]|nr:C40 family peptidase [Candidatus Micrarchaeota archaeon]